jgi:hypothetical protein
MCRQNNTLSLLTRRYHSVQLRESRDACGSQFANQKAATTALESLGGEMAELAEHHRMIEVRHLWTNIKNSDCLGSNDDTSVYYV